MYLTLQIGPEEHDRLILDAQDGNHFVRHAVDCAIALLIASVDLTRRVMPDGIGWTVALIITLVSTLALLPLSCHDPLSQSAPVPVAEAVAGPW